MRAPVKNLILSSVINSPVNMKLVVLLTVLLSANYCLGTQPFFGSRRSLQYFTEPPIQSFKTPFVATKWITQKLDNFDPQNTKTWQMRYMENNQFFKPGGPIFVYIGGEWIISPGWLQTGHMYDMAKELNGTMYYTEHRYYGESRPTPDTSTENLRYLNIDQALADLANFIVQKKSENPDMKDSGVILVGGSYSATMATWFRQKYPHLANGAWSSSAPLLAKVDFIEYIEVVTESIKLVGGKTCANRIETAVAEIEKLVSQNEIEHIKELFNMCTLLDTSNKLDVMSFFGEIGSSFSGVVQYNNGIQDACRLIEDDTVAPVKAFANFFNKQETSKCFDHLYENIVDYYNKTEWTDKANLHSNRQWYYQTCSEYGWYQTSSSENQIFGSGFPVEFYTQMCHDFFDGIFDKEIIEENADITNVRYGGMNPHFTNVYSTHGQLDPWRAMGIQEDLNPQSPTVVIPMVAHVADLRSISIADSEEMRASKNRISKLVREWLNLS